MEPNNTIERGARGDIERILGERYSFKIRYRFQVYVPKRQILHYALCSNAVFRSALTCLSIPFTPFPVRRKTNGSEAAEQAVEVW